MKVAELLRTVKDSLGLRLTFLSRLDCETQHQGRCSPPSPSLATVKLNPRRLHGARRSWRANFRVLHSPMPRASAPRFSADYPSKRGKLPDEVFAGAASVGVGIERQIRAVRRATEEISHLSGYLSINFSPDTTPEERSLVDFNHHSGAHVVAEGVETRDDALAFLNVGVDYRGGRTFARPGSLDQLIDFHRMDDENA